MDNSLFREKVPGYYLGQVLIYSLSKNLTFVLNLSENVVARQRFKTKVVFLGNNFARKTSFPVYTTQLSNFIYQTFNSLKRFTVRFETRLRVNTE